MKRRTFFGASLGTAALASNLTGCSGTQSPGGGEAGGVTAPGAIGTIGGMTLEELKEQYRYDLFDDFLVFFDKYIVDHELGGFMCDTDHDGTHNSTEKRTWYLGRGSWCYSFLYN
ncbi:MAG: hypothetical protein J7M24_07265, partial [Candidatus Latescibacteria bacterium]|nr:hypothetical protein [Candidatus Latescibacterota bacterium]